MENHDRQHHQAQRARTKNNDRHRQASRQRLLRTAELNRNTVGTVEAQALSQLVSQPQHKHHNNRHEHDQQHDLPPRHARPHTLHHRSGKRRIHDHHDRELIQPLGRRLLGELPHPAARQLTEHKRQEQLNGDVQEDRSRELNMARVHQQHGEQRGRHHTHNRRERGAHNRRRHVTARNGRKRNRRLHGRGHKGQEQNAHVQPITEHKTQR